MQNLIAPPPPHPGAEIAVLMSGGVDSSVTALLLQRAGWRVIGCSMTIPSVTGGANDRHVDDTRRVCEALSIPLHLFDLDEEFMRCVVEPFRQLYCSGRTPNPCVLCNPAVKFGLLRERVRETLGIRDLATGHYAQVRHQGQVPLLARPVHHDRDQSYFLYRLPSDVLKHLHLPLGAASSKDQVRAVAEEAGLPAARRDDSMEICFLPQGDYRSLLPEQARQPGNFLDTAGNTIGRHAGVGNYTLGQRRGLGVALGEPAYVVGIDPLNNTVTLGGRHVIETRDVVARDLRLHLPERFRVGHACLGRVRSSGEPEPCCIASRTSETLTVRFERAVFAPAAGQHLVLYNQDGIVLGGGEIA